MTVRRRPNRLGAPSLLIALSGALLPTTAGRAQAPAEAQAQEQPPSAAEQGPDADDKRTPTVQALPAELRPTMQLKVSPEEDLHVGDPITVMLTAVAPEGTRISVPKRDLTPFEVLDRDVQVLPAKDGKQTHVFKLTLLTFEADAASLPALELRVVTPDQRLGSVFTDARPLDIRSLVANEPDAKPLPESAPVEVMADDYTLAWVGGGLLAALLMAGLGFWLARWYRRKPAVAPPPPPPRPAWELALDDLDSLARQRDAWLAEDRAGEYVDRVSDVVRHYLGARYGFDGLESTTDEVVATLSKRRPRELPMTDVVTLLQECDLVKFAKAPPDAELCESVHAQALAMVRRSMPTASEGTSDA